LNWSLEGLDRLNERGHFVQPASGADALQQLEDLSSPVGAFVRDRCERGPELQVDVDDLWQAWRSWSDGAGVHHGTKAAFGKDLHAAIPEVKRIRPRLPDRTYVYAGIRLREQTARGWSQ
jgi:putative DNA primase/helicase